MLHMFVYAQVASTAKLFVTSLQWSPNVSVDTPTLQLLDRRNKRSSTTGSIMHACCYISICATFVYQKSEIYVCQYTSTHSLSLFYIVGFV
jgi:hypothetical protein